MREKKNNVQFTDYDGKKKSWGEKHEIIYRRKMKTAENLPILQTFIPVKLGKLSCLIGW